MSGEFMANVASDLRTDFALLINGQLRDSAEHLDVINPATGQVFARCPAATRQHLDEAVAAARVAAKSWSKTSFEERRALIKKFSESLQANKEALGRLLTMEQGKSLGQASEEIARAGAQSEGMANIKIEPEVLVDNAERHIELHYSPLGVVGVITPWNAPINLAAGPLVSALYTGNCVILKPSPYTPLCTLKLGELLKDIFPAGVVNVLAGGDELGKGMTEHAGIDKISFTGSVASGKKVMAACAGTLKRVTLELGGNDAAIVLDDVDVKAIAPKLFFAGFVNSGQVCMAIKRIYAHEKIYDALCDAMAEEARKAKFGNGLEPGMQYGPIQNKMQYDKVRSILEDTHKIGGHFLTGAEQPNSDGYFVNPAIVTDVPDDSRLVREEQFGPVLPILKFSNVEDAIARANNTRYGLAGSVWSKDIERAKQIALRLEVGTAWVNQHRATAANIPFGGAKESGVGRHYSILGLKSNMEPKVLSILK
jgi:acyl-CoA reductase-like NAD-dependent aldehyde dehydrogenase